jgi:hypothetical protein
MTGAWPASYPAAASFAPGIVLDRQRSLSDRKPVALVGKVYCKVDADCGAVAVGDLLTTAATPGHAMKAAGTRSAHSARSSGRRWRRCPAAAA